MFLKINDEFHNLTSSQCIGRAKSKKTKEIDR